MIADERMTNGPLGKEEERSKIVLRGYAVQGKVDVTAVGDCECKMELGRSRGFVLCRGRWLPLPQKYSR